MAEASFDRRIQSLVRKHARMTDGIRYRIDQTGLITAHPRRRLAPPFPWRSLAALVFLAWGFKVALFALLGVETYAARLAVLEGGSLLERAGAWVMTADAATRLAATVAADLARVAGF